MVVNPQIVKNFIENISKSDRRTYKLGRILIVKTPQFGGKTGEIIVPNDVNVDETAQNVQKFLNDKFKKKNLPQPQYLRPDGKDPPPVQCQRQERQSYVSLERPE